MLFRSIDHYVILKKKGCLNKRKVQKSNFIFRFALNENSAEYNIWVTEGAQEGA